MGASGEHREGKYKIERTDEKWMETVE